MALNTVVGALELSLAKLHVQRIVPPPEGFDLGPCFLVTYFQRGYFFSSACCLAKIGSNATLDSTRPTLEDEIVGALPIVVADKLGGEGPTILTLPPFF